MEKYGIHVVWLLVAVVGAAGWGKVVASQKEREFRERAPVQAAPRPRPPVEAPVAARPAEDAPVDAPPSLEGAPDLAVTARTETPLGPEQIRALLRSKDRREVERGLRAVEKLGDRALKLDLLRDALGSGESRIRERALEVLRRLGGPEAAELVAGALRNDASEDVRRRAARYLGELGGPSAVAALQDAAGAESLRLAVTASGSLNKLGHPGPMHLVIQKVGGLLDHPDGALREDAVGYFDELRTPAAVPQLSRALRDSNSDVRRRAIEALDDLALPEILPLLQEALNDPHPAVVRDAQRAIERLQAPR